MPIVRRIVGIAGPPGAGKSTLAARVVAAVPNAALVAMDGFHLANSELDRLGRRDRKGAPDTFDAAGFVALLRRLRHEPLVYAPVFDRSIETSVAAALPIGPEVELVVTEGNYLLLDDGPWSEVRDCLDRCVFVDVDPLQRVSELVERHVGFGKSREAATEWVLRSDEHNARLVDATKSRADLVVTRASCVEDVLGP